MHGENFCIALKYLTKNKLFYLRFFSSSIYEGNGTEEYQLWSYRAWYRQKYLCSTLFEMVMNDISWLMSIYIGKLVCLGENNSDKRQPKR